MSPLIRARNLTAPGGTNEQSGQFLARPRRELYEHVAQQLISDFAETVKREPELVARHLTLGGKSLGAAGRWLRAGGAAIQRGSAREAAALLQAGLDALVDQPDYEARRREELGLLALLGPAQMVMKGPGSAEFGAVQRHAYDTCRVLPDAIVIPHHPRLALYHWGKAEFATALPLAAALDGMRADDPSEEHTLAAGNMNGMVRLHLGDSRGRATAWARRSRFTSPRTALSTLHDGFRRVRPLLSRRCLRDDGAGDLGAAHAQDAVRLAERLASRILAVLPC